LLQKLANRVTVFDHGDEFTIRQPDDTLDILNERLDKKHQELLFQNFPSPAGGLREKALQDQRLIVTELASRL
jgi:hypothetical protein